MIVLAVYFLRCCRVSRRGWTTVSSRVGRMFFVGSVVMVVMDVMVSSRVSRMFFVVVWSVVLDDCLSLFGASCV